MLRTIFTAVVSIVVALAVFVALQPSDFSVSRSIVISAPASAVFPHVNDLHQWKAWSPWAKLDPNAKETIEGPSEGGEGAVMKWAGNQSIGEGSMMIIESSPNELVQFRLEFLKPFKGTNSAKFTFRPEGEQTIVTWNMSGKKNFLSKAIGLVMNCDKMIGGQFDKGLADLKTVSETAK